MKKTFNLFGLACLSASLSLVALCGSAIAQNSGSTKNPEWKEDHAQEAAEWMQNFINPGHVANYDSLRLIGYDQLRGIGNRPAMKTLSSAAWVQVATSEGGRQSGRPTGVDFDAAGDIYMTTTVGGLWKTTDNGTNWVSLSNSWKSLNSGGVAVDPNNPNIIYVGTGCTDGNYQVPIGFTGIVVGIGVYKSVDAGLNWVLLDSLNTNTTFQMEVNPANSSIVYRALANGIRRSTNGGVTWASVLSLGGFTSIVIDPLNPGVLYAAGGGTVSKSYDTGKTWSTLPAGYPTGPQMILGMSRVSSDSVYLSAGSDGIIAVSADSGHTWTTKSSNTDYLGTQGEYANAMAVNPTNPTIVVAGGLDIYSSFSSGLNLKKVTDWTSDPSSSNYSHADIHTLKYDRYTGTLYALTDGGIFYSKNNGGIWSQNMNASLATLLFIGGDMAVDPTTGLPSYFCAGAQDNGLNGYAYGTTPDYYSTLRGGDGGTMFIASDAQTIFGTYVQATLYRSEDRGETWDNGGVDANDPNNILGSQLFSEGAPFYMEYDVWDGGPNVVACCGNNNLFLSTDGSIGPSAFPKVTNIGTGTTVSGSVLRVNIATNNPENIYIGTSGGGGSFYFSLDQGTTWTRSTTPTSFGALPTGITTDPNNENNVFMTVATSTDNGASKHFYFSTDNGQTWTAPATNLPALNYRRIAMDANGIIYVGHDYGVLRSGDTGKTWYPVADGLPMAMVTSLQVRGNYLTTTMLGRGQYYVDLTQVPPIGTSSVAASPANSGVVISAIYPSIVSASAPRTTVDYTLPGNEQATLAVYDIVGREEKVLVNQFATEGAHEIGADLSGLISGQYYMVLTAGGTSVTKSFVIE